jgi:hypothetical protein
MTPQPEPPEKCQTCEGRGSIPFTRGQTPESFEQGEYPCPDCTNTTPGDGREHNPEGCPNCGAKHRCPCSRMKGHSERCGFRIAAAAWQPGEVCFDHEEYCCATCYPCNCGAITPPSAPVEQTPEHAQTETPENFPIMGGPTIPWVLIAPHERQALLNHDQSLAKLASRGGLSCCEAVAVLEDRKWRAMDRDAARNRLIELRDASLERRLSAQSAELAELRWKYAHLEEEANPLIDANTDLQVATAELERVKAEAKESRREGRAEALAILIREDAERFMDKYMEDYPNGDAGDSSIGWNFGDLQQLFDTESQNSMVERIEAETWRLRGEIMEIEAQLATAIRERDEAREDAKRLREDKARLDWLEKSGGQLTKRGRERTADDIGVFWEYENGDFSYEGKVLRAALDAARQRA